MNSNLTNHIIKSYQGTRLGLVWTGFVFAPLLYVGGAFATLRLQDSMSAYYHAGGGAMRSWFVGLLFAIGFILFLYKGFTRMEDQVLNLAGVTALGVALFPMGWTGFEPVKVFGVALHYICAVTLFICMGYVCIFRASDTLSLVESETNRNRLRLTYKTLGVLMLAAPVLVYVASEILKWTQGTFFVEMAGVSVFAVYWLVKSREIAATEADRKAVQGNLLVQDHKATTHLFRTVQITQPGSANKNWQASAPVTQ